MWFSPYFSFLADEQPLAGTNQGGAPPLAGLAAPSAEVAAVVGERGGVPIQAIPTGLSARLTASLQGQETLVQGGGRKRSLLK